MLVCALRQFLICCNSSELPGGISKLTGLLDLHIAHCALKAVPQVRLCGPGSQMIHPIPHKVKGEVRRSNVQTAVRAESSASGVVWAVGTCLVATEPGEGQHQWLQLARRTLLNHVLLLPAAVCLQELASAPKLKSLQLEGNPFDDKKMPKVRPAFFNVECCYAWRNFGAVHVYVQHRWRATPVATLLCQRCDLVCIEES
jgi:hypothetical protein